MKERLFNLHKTIYFTLGRRVEPYHQEGLLVVLFQPRLFDSDSA